MPPPSSAFLCSYLLQAHTEVQGLLTVGEWCLRAAGRSCRSERRKWGPSRLSPFFPRLSLGLNASKSLYTTNAQLSLAQCARHCLFPMLLPLSDDSFIPHWCAAGDSPQDLLRCSPRVHPCSGYHANRPCVWLVGVALEEVGTHDTRFMRGQGTNILGGLGTPAPSWDYRLDPQLSSVPEHRALWRAVAHLMNT